MRAYHLGRARSPTDLPPWLFTERERGVAQNAWTTSSQGEYEDRFLPDRDPEIPQRGGLRDVYDRAASSSSVPSMTLNSAAEHGDRGGSRAANRLKAIRDAKRSAITASEPAQSHSEDGYRNMTTSGIEQPGGEASGPQRRVGLPARPGKMRRQ